ncbi:hypothetical protein NB037_13545 [Rathayibacter sp. ZW T2_19]|uniref:Uncharacterized protein n=1 Tax=Rathayibacter rubneri TaxID=2950106 RepID=A0A9X2E000_9MICO|nr:hypothetical protein [Rathayibacter rubneri]MCM6763446.1 hypothetical protein [Rathayibacter rubneri]
MGNGTGGRELRRLQRQHRELLHRHSLEVADPEWDLVRDAVLSVLTEEDLCGLFPGSPADEYLFEAVDLTRLLLQDGACLGLHVRSCWAAQFDTVLDVETADRLAERITAEVRAATAPTPSADPVREAGAEFLLGGCPPLHVVAAAVEHVAAGVPGERLLALASLYSDASVWEVLDALNAALAEAGEPPLVEGDDETAILALRSACRRFLAGGTDLRSLSSWTHSAIGHDGPEIAEPLVLLDDDLDLWGAQGVEPDATALLDARLRAAAFLRATA